MASGSLRPTVAAFAFVVVAYALHLTQWTFLCDDAYISFRYAANLAEYGELVYNIAPLERIEGYTNPLWVLVLAVVGAVGIPIPEAAMVLCGLAGVAVLGLSVALMRTLMPGAGARATAPAALLVLSPEFVVWGSGGLETMAVVALGLASWLSFERNRLVAAAAFASAAVLTRADAGLWLGMLLAARALGCWRDPAARPEPRRFFVAVLVAGGPVLAHLLWRWSYYGQWAPNTWAIKQFGSALRDPWGSEYVASWARHGGAALALCVPWMRARHLAPFVGAAVSVVWAWWVGGDFMAYSRFALPATVLCAITVGWIWIELTSRPERRIRGVAWAVAAAVVLAGTIVAPARIRADAERPWLDERWETVRGMDTFAARRVAAGLAFARTLAPETRVIVGAAGAMPWASGLPTWDAYGLVSPGVLDDATISTGKGARPGHQVRASPRYLRQRSPDLLCHVGAVAERPPGRSAAARRGGAGATWECVQTGPLPARVRGDRSSRYYCCVRPAQGSTDASPRPLDGP